MTLAQRRTGGTLAGVRGRAGTRGALASVRGSASPGVSDSGGSTRITTVGAVGGGRLGEAVEEIAAGVREFASWSAKILATLDVSVGETSGTISSQVGPSYPGETRARHPLFGNRRHWYGPPGHPFLSPAADARAGAAMAKYAKKIDDLAHKAGFE